jgi:tetratricopeptide (TPR) repeat protein
MSRGGWQSFLIAAVLVIGASAVNAQQIQGTVRNAATQQPIMGALVRCSGSGGTNEHLTDPNGKFFFRVSPGHYECSVRASGFREQQESKDLLDTQSSEYLDFRLTADSGSAGTSAVASNIPAKAREDFDKGAAAIALGKKENLEEAVLHLEKAVAAYPKYTQAYLMLGATYVDLQQLDKGELVLKKVVEIDPKAANALFGLGEIYLRQKKYEEAEKVLQQGLQIEDRSYLGHLALARAYVAMAAKIKEEAENRPLRVKAYEQVNEALKYNADLALAHWLKGNLLISVGRDGDAKTEFQEYLRIDEKGPFANQAKTLIERIKKVESEKKP